MKKLLPLTIALFALPLFADEPAKKDTPQATAVTTTAAAQPASADSPLVAASKKSNRKGKTPKNVITNETLKKSTSAHITTTTVQRPLPTAKPGAQTEEQLRTEKAVVDQLNAERAAQTALKKDEAEKKKQRLAAAAAAAESEYVDPAIAEGELQEAAKTEKAGEKKPPQR